MGGPSSELAAHRDLGRWQAELRRHPEPCQPPPGRAFPSRGEGTPAELGTKHPERRSEPERQSSGSLSGVHLVRRPLAARSRAESLANAEARRAQSSGPVGAQASPRASSLGRDVAVEA